MRPSHIVEDAIRLWLKTAQDDGLEIPRPRGCLVYA
jgi:predicted RNase H-like HicB family nuclease